MDAVCQQLYHPWCKLAQPMLQMLGLLKKVKGEVKGEVNKEVVIDPEEGEDKQGGLRVLER
jgi:hypothetical protein